MKNTFPGGVWPVMLTPFTENNEVDYNGLEKLIEWYITQGVQGLFAVCQSSEMFFLSLQERIKIAAFVKEKAAGRVPVIASGHISDNLKDQEKEIIEIAKTGVDAVILVTNRLATKEESDSVWIANLEALLKKLPATIKLGLYECPYPYKRIMSKEMTKWCADSGRFYFLKDTSCDIDNIKIKLDVCKGSLLKLYNANTATLLESLRLGAAGYSGVMANMQCSLYERLCNNFQDKDMEQLAEKLTMCALIEGQGYPSNAKYYLQRRGLPILSKSRTQDEESFTQTYRKEADMLYNITVELEKEHRKELYDDSVRQAE